MTSEYKVLSDFLDYITNITNFKPKVAIVLGSGLGEFVERIKVKCEIAYSSIKGFPVSTVSGHEGKFVFGYIQNIPVVAMKGRIHCYEGYTPLQTVMPVRLMGMLGCEYLILTNAAGGINKSFNPGELMLICDHISLFVKSPLVGENINEFGTRFPDMSNVYDNNLALIAQQTAKSLKIKLNKGVYVQLSGPNYETPAEIKMLGGLGADAVGMSTVCEAIAAKHMGMKICGLSCITNMAAGICNEPLSHDDVKKAADAAQEQFNALVWNIVINTEEKVNDL